MSTNLPGPVDEPDDDEALHWAGDDARGQAGPRLRDTASDAPADSPAGAEVDAPASAVPAGRTRGETALLVATGVFAGLYLALVVGWILAVQLLAYPGLDLAGEVMWQFAEFLSMVAPALWFAIVLTLTPSESARRGVKRVVWLTVGLALLLPWPFLLGALG